MCESISSKLFPLRNLHAGLSDFTEARVRSLSPSPSLSARARAHAKSPARQEFEQVPGKYFGSFFQFYQRYVGPPLRFRESRERVSFLVRLGIVGSISTRQRPGLCVSAPVSALARHMGSVVHYTRERRRAESRRR